MRVLKREPMLWRLRIETEGDLWSLARLAQKGMSIAMLGERRDQTTGGDEGGRAKSAERKKMWIKLAIESTEHQAFSDILRVHGIISESPIDIGSHHTHNITMMDEVEITTFHPFKNTDKELLQQSVDASRQVKVALAVVENDEIILFYVTPRGLRESTTWAMRGGGKRVDTKSSSLAASDFRSKVIREITDTLDDQTPLILSGPGHARDILLQELKDAGQTRFMTSIATSMSGRSGANEVLREGLAGNLLDQYAITREISLLEQVWVRISTNGAVAYGQVDLIKALQEGAIEIALVAVDLLRDEGAFIGDMTWSKWAEGLSEIGAELVQCSTDHDSGQQLLGMGGAVALLRYNL